LPGRSERHHAGHGYSSADRSSTVANCGRRESVVAPRIAWLPYRGYPADHVVALARAPLAYRLTAGPNGTRMCGELPTSDDSAATLVWKQNPAVVVWEAQNCRIGWQKQMENKEKLYRKSRSGAAVERLRVPPTASPTHRGFFYEDLTYPRVPALCVRGTPTANDGWTSPRWSAPQNEVAKGV
jgi:hypothetical protein